MLQRQRGRELRALQETRRHFCTAVRGQSQAETMADDLQTLLDSLQAALVPPTKAAARLPAADDLQFERTLSRKLARALDHEQERVLSLAQRVLDWTSASATKVVDADLIREGVYNPVTERVEPLLEVADDAIDLHLGQGKHRRNAGVGALGAKSAQELELRAKQKDQQQRLPARLLHDSALEKPQLRFTERTRVPIPHVDEAVDGVPLWKPLLREKVNAQSASEGGWLATEVYEPKSSYTQTTGTVPPAYTRYTHPYAAELATLTPPARFLEKPDPTSRVATTTTTAAESFAKTPFEWVGDAAALERMVDEIRQVGQEEAGGKDLAIDLEHHDYRSWSGMTCLIQVRSPFLYHSFDPLFRRPSPKRGSKT